MKQNKRRQYNYKSLNIFTKEWQPSRKHTEKHWSYRRRLIKIISKDNYLRYHQRSAWKRCYYLMKTISYRHKPNKALLNAIKAMRHYLSQSQDERRCSSLSISKIARRYAISKPTLYRAYYAKYGRPHHKH